MIVARLEDSARYASVHSRFAKVFELAGSADIRALPAGKHVIDGDDLFVMVVRGNAEGHKDNFLEAHRRYIDVQFTVTGEEEIGYKHISHARNVTLAYTDAEDAELFSDAPSYWVKVPAETFAVLFPEDAHAPMQGKGAMHKLVFKVRI